MVFAILSAQTSIGWGNLQWPFSISIVQNETTENIYGQVWMGGVTNQPGQGAGITAQLGYGVVNSTPDESWIWFNATYFGDSGNNDEYIYNLLCNMAAGSYHYTYRYHYVGDAVYYYAAGRGTLTVNDVPPPLYEVTFQVDMQFQTVSENGVFIAGSFNGWNPTATPMQAPSREMIYTVTLELESAYYEYKFVNGSAWENVSNRTINTPAENYLVPAVFFDDFGGGTTQEVTVTFQVDMSVQQNVTSVYLAGDFTGWGNSPIQMFINSRNVYTADVLFPAGSNIEQEFKYIMNEFSTWETINNRLLTINDESSTQILDVVYFNNQEPQEGTTQNVTVTFQINMSGLDFGWYENGVSIQGNVLPLDWNGGSNLLSLEANLYVVDILFPAGSPYGVEYKFARLDGDMNWNFETFDGNRYFEIDDSGSTMFMNVHFWDNIIPEPVVTITMDGNNAQLTWAHMPGTSYYDVYGDTDPNGAFETKVNFLPVLNHFYTHNNVAGTKYFYRVKAIQE